MSSDVLNDAETHRLGLGKLRMIQQQEIFKFTVDPLLLAAFLPIRPQELVLDLGTGTGVLPLWLTGYRGVKRVVGLELQPEVAALARQNVVLNELETEIQIITGDLRALPQELVDRRFDWVLSNPPYWKASSHLHSASPVLARAKFELTCTLEEVIAAAARLCRSGGRVGFVHLPERLTDLLALMRAERLEPKRLCLVYPKPGTAPHRLLIEGKKNSRPGLKVLKPFYIHDQNGDFSTEMMAVYHGQNLE